MGTLIKPNGVSTTILPADGKGWTLKELYHHIGCEEVECVTLPDGRTMWLDGLGKFKYPQEINGPASALLSLAGGADDDKVVGTVLIMTKEETEEDDR